MKKKSALYLLFFLFLLAPVVLSGALRADDSVPDLMENARSLYFRGRITKAAKLYEEALKKDPRNLEACLNLGTSYRAIAKNDLAILAFKKALELEAGNPDIHSETGWLYFYEGRYAEARDSFLEALKIDRTHPGALMGLGVVQMELGRPDESAKTFKKLISQRENFAAGYFFLGRACRKTGDFEGALKNYQMALKKDWAFAEVRPYLAEAYQNLSQGKKAWSELSKVVSLDPEDEQAKDALEELSEEIPEEISEEVPMGALSFTNVRAVDDLKKGDLIRVGLWTTPTGQPQDITSFEFEVSGPFQVVGLKTGKVFAAGQRGERWKAVSAGRGQSDLMGPDGKKLGPFKYGIAVRSDAPNQTILIQGATGPGGKPKEFLAGREYRGTLLIMPRRKATIYAVNEIHMEPYLLGVLPAEMPAEWPLEALKAQAVVARNQVLIRRKYFRPHFKKFDYDLCDSQHCQVYRGVRVESENTRNAVEQTFGKCLYFGERLAQSYYHGNCGGHTLSSSEAKGWGREPYLTGKFDLVKVGTASEISPWELGLWLKKDVDSNCNLGGFIPSSEFRWVRVVPARVLGGKLNRRFRIGQIKEIIPLNRAQSGHINELLIQGSRRETVIKKEHLIRYHLGSESLRSALFQVETRKDKEGQPVEFWIYGGGWGHGVGMCQTGAAGLARKFNMNCEDILKFYYPGTEVKSYQ